MYMRATSYQASKMTNLVINVFSGGDNTYLRKTQIQISDYTGLFVNPPRISTTMISEVRHLYLTTW